MLIVTVTEREEIVLSRDGVEIGTVSVKIRGDGRVRVGLQFPKAIKIVRKELDGKEEGDE